MSRLSLLLVLCFVVAATCLMQAGVPLRAPAGVPMTRAVTPTAVADAGTVTVSSAAAAATNLIATNSGDFGGNAIPIIGLVLLAATIGFLAGPVED